MSAVLKKSSPGKFAYTCHFQQIGINATKIEKTGIHFKTHVFDAVAVVDAKAPYYYLDRLLTRTVLMNNRVRVKKKIEKTERQLRIKLWLMVTLMLKRL